MMLNVRATTRFPGPAFDELDSVSIGALDSPDDALRTTVDALMVAGSDSVGADVLGQWPNLRLISTVGVGYDGIDVGVCRARGIVVTHTPGVLDEATADLAFALLMTTRRRVAEGDRLIRAHGWTPRWGDTHLSGDVFGAKLGIVGLGRIGRAVARRARAFSMDLVYNDVDRDEEAEGSLGVRWSTLDELLAGCDIVTLHVPLTSETRSFIGARELSLMRDGATLINASRGAVLDEHALVDELRSGRLSAGLDVFLDEPHVPAPLLTFNNVVLTPHIGSATTTTRHAMTRLAVDNILAVGGGRPPLTPVPE